MKTPENLEAAVATRDDLARLKAELQAAVRELDEHRTATLFMLEDLEENRKRIERARQEWVRVLDGVPDPIFVHDREFRIVRCNRAYAERAGMLIQEVIGKPYWEVFPKREGPLPGCHALEKAEEAEEEVRVDSGELFLSRSFLVQDDAGAFLFAVHIMEDVTQRREQEARIEHLNRLIRSASNINRLITSEKDRGSLLQGACDVLVREAGYRMVWIGIVQQGRPEVMPVAKSGVGAADYLESIIVTCDDTPTGHGPAGTAIRTRKPSIIQDVARDPRFALWRDIALQNGYRACANFPLISDNTTYGVVNLYAGKPDAFDAEEIVLLSEVADDIAFALRGMDIETDRKRAEQALQDSEEKLHTISSSAQDAIVMADNDGRIEFWNPSAEKLFGYTLEEAAGNTLQDLIVPERLREKHQSGYEQFKATGQGPVIGKVLELPSLRKGGSEFVAEYSISAVKLRGKWNAVAVVRDITERKEAEKKRRYDAEMLRRSLEDTIRVVALTVEMRDPYTAGHQRRVADLAVAIAKELGLPEDQIHGLHLAGIVHDLGKIQVPSEILSKPGKITDIEFSFIKTHPQAGYEILKNVEFPWPIAQIVLQHHERLDGSGYPHGLKAEQILLEARILAVADVVEAMASHRPYRTGLGIDTALAEIEHGRGRAYDPATVDACVKLFREKGFAFTH